MRTLIAIGAAAFVGSTALAEETRLPMSDPIQVAAVCFGKGEMVSGFTKICYYDCLGSTVAITVRSTDLCPLTINN